MSSMAVAGLAKSLIAVTLTLNPAAAHHGPGSYTVRPGDTLSAIAARTYGSAADWPAIWWAAAGFSVSVTAISDLASPATAILDMSGFLLWV